MQTENFELTQIKVPVAARRLGITEQTLYAMIKKQLVPVERIGKKMFIEETIVDAIKELRRIHGNQWSKHAQWNQNVTDVEVAAAKLPSDLNAKLCKLAKEYRMRGHADIALQLHDILFDQYEF